MRMQAQRRAGSSTWWPGGVWLAGAAIGCRPAPAANGTVWSSGESPSPSSFILGLV